MRILLFIFTLIFFISANSYAGSNKMQKEPSKQNEYIGKILLARINYYDKNAQLLKIVERAGMIKRIDKQYLTLQLLNSKKEFTLPPDLSAIKTAQRGTFHLKNGNVVSVDYPDFTLVYNVYSSHDSNRADTK